MNILFVQNDLNPTSGGIARVSNLLYKIFIKHGYNVYFLYCLSDYDKIDDCHKHKYTLSMDGEYMYRQVFDFVKKIPGGVNYCIIQGLFFRSIQYAFVRLRKECGFKIIACLHGAPSGLLPVYEKGVIVWCKNMLRWVLGRTQKQVMKRMCKQADQFVLLSDSFRKEMVDCYGVVETNSMKVIPNPLTFNEFATEEQIRQKKKEVLIISRLHEKDKNLKAALRIWKKIEKNGVAGEWHLVLAGHGDDEQELLDYGKKLQLQRFEFVGRTDNPLELYQRASVFMMTSHYEGFGMTLTESLQNGVVPIVFGSFGAVYDIINDGENGYIIPPFDENLYADKMLQLFYDDTIRVNMAKKAVESSRKFSIEAIGTKWEELLNID